MPDTEKVARPRKTPAEKAQAVMDAAEKRVTKAEKRVAALKEDIGPAEKELTAAKAARDYASQHPDLPGNEGKSGVTVQDEDTVSP